MSNLREVVALLGVGDPTRTWLALVPLVRKGLPYAAIERVSRELELSVDDVARALGVARRTLVRSEAASLLDASASERVVRLGRILIRATDALGSPDKARRWMTAPNRALDGLRPLDMLDTDIGAEAVEDVLARVEGSVFS